ncbi:MAG: nucleotidyltransferase family protein, partial [Pseudomonadota bacterium]
MSLRVIILAGQRPGGDPLCDHAGVTYKADVEIAGIAMVERVAEALRGAGLTGPFELSGYPDPRQGFMATESGEGPADSALMAASSGDFPVLVTTCDHALLTPDMVMEFLEGAQQSG